MRQYETRQDDDDDDVVAVAISIAIAIGYIVHSVFDVCNGSDERSKYHSMQFNAVWNTPHTYAHLWWRATDDNVCSMRQYGHEKMALALDITLQSLFSLFSYSHFKNRFSYECFHM